MTTLDDLIAKVEAGRFRVADAEAFFPERAEHADEDPAYHMVGAYQHSLDAAKALHEAVMPDVRWNVWHTYDHEYACNLTDVDSVFSSTPARAWLLAILKAMKEARE